MFLYLMLKLLECAEICVQNVHKIVGPGLSDSVYSHMKASVNQNQEGSCNHIIVCVCTHAFGVTMIGVWNPVIVGGAIEPIDFVNSTSILAIVHVCMNAWSCVSILCHP